MQRIIVFLGLVLVGGSLAVGTGWPGGHGPTIPRPDLAATSSPVPSSSPSASELPAHQRYLPTPTPTSATPSTTPSATPASSPSPSASPSGMPNITPPPMPSMPPSPQPCGGCGTGAHEAGVACPMFCVEKTN